jgi:hypothetical protein
MAFDVQRAVAKDDSTIGDEWPNLAGWFSDRV